MRLWARDGGPRRGCRLRRSHWGLGLSNHRRGGQHILGDHRRSGRDGGLQRDNGLLDGQECVGEEFLLSFTVLLHTHSL